MIHLAISLLGPFQVTLDGKAVTYFGSDTARALLSYLAMHAGMAHRREALAGLLWPEQFDVEALRNLRVTLSRLRDAIGDRTADVPLLQVTRHTILLTGDARCALDVRAVRTSLAATREHKHTQLVECAFCAQRLREAAELYRGEFLDGFTLDSVPFEEWVVTEREGLHWQVLEALYTLASYHELQGNYDAEIECARRQVELEPWHEAAYRQWMRALALSGRRGAALAQYDACRQVLANEMGLEPEVETVTLYERIRTGALAPGGEPVPGPAAAEARLEAAPLSVAPAAPEEMPVTAPWAAVTQVSEGELRMVTVVQAEVSGTAELLTRVSVEDWAEIASQLLRVVGAEVRRFGGEVDRYDESGLVAVFGAQVAHEDDPERGVLAALAMQASFKAQLAQFTADLETWGGLGDLGLCVGVHTGETVVTAIEEHEAGWRVAMVDAVSSVHRMLALVAPGEVRVDEGTYYLIAPLFEWKMPAEVEGGGQGYVPLAHKELADKGRGIPGMRSTLVGREGKLRALSEAVERLQSGIGGVVTLVGEAGIGKSRLVAECRAAFEASVQWVEGRCLSYGGQMAYLPWLDVLRALVGVTADAAPLAVGRVLGEKVQALCADRFEATYAYLGKLISAPLDERAAALVAQMDTEGLKNGIACAVRLFLERTAQEQPLVVVCEDLHWADPTSLSLLEQLLPLTDRVPLLFVCVLRPQREHGSWRIRETAMRSYPHRHIDLQLEPLSAAEGETLLGNLLVSLPGPDGRKPIEGLPAGLKARILDRGEGNPFYVQEILRALIHNGAIVCDRELCCWRAGWEEEDIRIPDTLYGVLQARIDQLPVGARRVLQLASVIGWVFSHRLLAEVAARSGLDAHLVTLQREQMIQERARLPETEYIFKHHLMFEVAYDSLLHRVRRMLHRRVAEAMECLYSERIADHLGLLAHHWEQAGEIGRSVDYLRRAGEKAAAQFANW